MRNRACGTCCAQPQSARPCFSQPAPAARESFRRPNAPRPPSGPRRPVVRPIAPGLPQDVERHRIALLVPLTGPNAGVGRSLQNATQLAMLDTKSDVLRITTYDTGAAGGAAAAAQQAIADGNRLILGPLLAEEAREVAPIARRARVPVLSFSNDASVAGNGTYLLGYSPGQSIERVVNYAAKSGITDFAGLIPTGLYGERASTALLRSVEQAGGKVLALETYDARPGSMTSAMAKIGRSPFQAILLAGSADGAVTAAPLIRRAPSGKTARLLGTELWNTDSAIGGKAASQRRLVRQRARQLLSPICHQIPRALRRRAVSPVDARL